MWNSLKVACTERNFNLQPKLIHVDFELTMHTVLNNVFPVTIKVPSSKISSAELVRNSKLEEQEKNNQA
jgi:hypothetical protein